MECWLRQRVTGNRKQDLDIAMELPPTFPKLPVGGVKVPVRNRVATIKTLTGTEALLLQLLSDQPVCMGSASEQGKKCKEVVAEAANRGERVETYTGNDQNSPLWYLWFFSASLSLRSLFRQRELNL